MLNRKSSIDYKPIHIPKFIEPIKLLINSNIELFILESGTQEICRLDLVYEAGSKHQNKPLQASLCNAMLLEGTKDMTGIEINEHLDFYGSYTQFDVKSDRATLSLFSLNKYFDRVFPIFINSIQHACFPEEIFQILIDQKKQSHIINLEKVEFLARNEFFRNLFSFHPYGKIIELTDFDNLSRDDIVFFHENYYKKGRLKIYLSGKKPKKFELLLKESFASFEHKKEFQKFFIPAFDSGSTSHILKNNSLQSSIRIGRPFFNSNHHDFYAFKFLSVLLGGYFGSRLMSNLREDKGLTYGVGAVCQQNEDSSYFVIYTEVKGESTIIALKEIYAELTRLRIELIPLEEVNLVKNYIMGQILKSADGPFNQSNLLKNLHINSEEFDYIYSYQKFLDKIDPHKLRILANKYLKKENLCEVIVGNKLL